MNESVSVWDSGGFRLLTVAGNVAEFPFRGKIVGMTMSVLALVLWVRGIAQDPQS